VTSIPLLELERDFCPPNGHISLTLPFLPRVGLARDTYDDDVCLCETRLVHRVDATANLPTGAMLSSSTGIVDVDNIESGYFEEYSVLVQLFVAGENRKTTSVSNSYGNISMPSAI